MNRKPDLQRAGRALVCIFDLGHEPEATHAILALAALGFEIPDIAAIRRELAETKRGPDFRAREVLPWSKHGMWPEAWDAANGVADEEPGTDAPGDGS